MTLLALKKNLEVFSQDIKLSHSLFSFPFVGASLIIAKVPLDLRSLTLIVISLTCARSFAMGMNRYFDRDTDSKNPRTRTRALPSKKISSLSLLLISLVFGGLFILSTLAYNKAAFYCSVPVLFILGYYPFTKRWTPLCHLYLGLCLALSPIGAAIALQGSVPMTSYLIAVALICWVSAFDIIYATQDYSFDKKESVNSLPTFLGIKTALRVSQLLFVLMMLSLITVGVIIRGGFLYQLGLGVIGFILFWEHFSLTKQESYESVKINPIFFTANAWVSVIFLLFVALDQYL